MKNGRDICFIVSVALIISGCAARPPLISSSGTIIEGDLKLNAMLSEIQELRKANEELPRSECLPVYIASMEPTAFPVSFKGILPKTKSRPSVEYSLISSSVTLDRCDYAVVTEVYVINGDIKTNNYIYKWDNDRWLYDGQATILQFIPNDTE